MQLHFFSILLPGYFVLDADIHTTQATSPAASLRPASRAIDLNQPILGDFLTPAVCFPLHDKNSVLLTDDTSLN
ncbi:hypothetical protein [Azohydromonas australica]|uniref:hypothetical protein n=1 Tax=Azohydromonas australica TaxID=364039 RepID=UPI0012EC6C4C|nr:hypothetical protein [Azohydromonas australica]